MLGLWTRRLFFHLCSSIYMRSTLFYGPATVALFRVAFFFGEKTKLFPPFFEKKSRGESDVVVGPIACVAPTALPPVRPRRRFIPKPGGRACVRRVRATVSSSSERSVGGKSALLWRKKCVRYCTHCCNALPLSFICSCRKKEEREKPPRGGGIANFGGTYCKCLFDRSFLSSLGAFFLRGGDSYELAVRQILFVGMEYTCSGEKSSKKAP